MDVKLEKTSQEITERNKKLIMSMQAVTKNARTDIMRFEQEGLLKNSPLSGTFRKLTDAFWMLDAEPMLKNLETAYRDLISKAEAYISHPSGDVNREEQLRWAQNLKELAEKALTDLVRAKQNNEFSEEELEFPASELFFPVDVKSVDREKELLEKEKKFEKLPKPEDSNVMVDIDKDVVMAVYAMNEIVDKFNAMKDKRSKIALLADISGATDHGIDKAGCGTELANVLINKLFLDENGEPAQDRKETLQEIADAIADWRLSAYREIKASGNSDAMCKRDLLRAETLIRKISMTKDSVARFGIDMEDLLILTRESMRKKATPEELGGMDEIGMVGPDDISKDRIRSLNNLLFDELSKDYPDLIINDDYINSVILMRDEIDEVVNASERFKHNDELSEIVQRMGTIERLLSLKSAGKSMIDAGSYTSSTAAVIVHFMENAALDLSWYEDDKVRESLLDTIDLIDYEKHEDYLKKEPLLKTRAENIKHGRQEIESFFEAQSSSSHDTVKKLFAAYKGDREECVTKMADILEKRYGLGKELSTALAAEAKNKMDSLDVVNNHIDPEFQWKSTGEFMKALLGNISNLQLNEYRISRKGNSVKAEYIPKLRQNAYELLESVESQKMEDKYYSGRLKGLLEAPESFDMMKDMFDTKKNYRLFNWNSSEYNDARDALESFTKERDRLIKMTDELSGRELTADETEKLRTQIRKTGMIMEDCISAVNNYVKKEGNGEITEKSQAAGLARIAGAKGMMDFFLKTGSVTINDPQNREIIRKDSVKVKKLSELYREEFHKAEKEGTKDRHRSAAKAAKTKTNQGTVL